MSFQPPSLPPQIPCPVPGYRLLGPDEILRRSDFFSLEPSHFITDLCTIDVDLTPATIRDPNPGMRFYRRIE